MKIRVESEKLLNAVKRLEGIELVLEDENDAREAFEIIIEKKGLKEREEFKKIKEIKMTPIQKYETSAVSYKLIFQIEFVFEDSVELNEKIRLIKELQEYFKRL